MANILKNPSRLAHIYSAASIIIGPFLLIFGYSFTRGGGDYCDAVYVMSNGRFDPSRVTEFQNAQAFQVTGSSIMIAIGLAIAVYAMIMSRRNQTKVPVLPLIGVLLMIFGYILVVVLSGKGGQVC